ncbi:MAG: DNA polymerase III subunit alpha, partial [Candidatus Eisenbacteria bacterium]
CLCSEVSSVFWRNGSRAAARLVSAYRELFGKHNYYLEICRHSIKRESRLNDFLISQSASYGIPLVATNDVHYLEPQDARTHDILLAIGAGTHLDDPKRRRLGSEEFFLRSPGEMQGLFPDLPAALAATVELSQRCSVNLGLGSARLPGFRISPGHTSRSYLRTRCEEGLSRRYASEEALTAARDRLEHELEAVAERGLSGYFLVVWDLVRFARSQKIPVGPGRGSSVGSIIAYCLGITDVDPIKYGLVFERFLSRERAGPPDIDVDLCHKCRDQVVQYLVKKYGRQCVAQIATLDTLAPRSAVRDAGRVLGIDQEIIDRVAGALPAGSSATVEGALRESIPLAKMYGGDERARVILDAARSIEGLPRHPSVHAAGVVITDAPLTDYVALERLASGEVIAQITKGPVEDLGLLKIDLLGLRFLSALYEAVSLVKTHRKTALEVNSIPLDDEATYSLIADGKTLGVLQLESSGMQDLLRQLRPEKLEDIIAMLSLYRPGPIGGGLVDKFVDRRHGREPVVYPHPMLEDVLRETFGVVLYQEQAMDIARVMAGFSMEEADGLRLAIARRRPGDLASMRHRFLTGAIEKSVDAGAAEEVFNLLLHFGGFGFNKSHSAAYALTTYRCAYMMVHFPREYITALLNNNFGFIERMRNYMAVARERNESFLPCDVNRSRAEFTLDGEGIRVGLAVVKHVGETSARDIVSERERWGSFSSLTSFCGRMEGKLNRQGIESLIKAGALECIGLRRSQMLAVLGQVLRIAGGGGAGETSGDGADGSREQFELGLRERVRQGECVEVPDMPEFAHAQLRKMERDATDLFMREHPLRDREHLLKQTGLITIDEALRAENGQTVSVAGFLAEFRRVRTKTSRRMAFLTLRDETAKIEAVVFPSVYEKMAAGSDGAKSKPLSMSWGRDEPIFVSGRIKKEDDSTKILCESVEPLTEALERFYSQGVLEIGLPEGFKNYSKLKNALLSSPGNSEVRIGLRQTALRFEEAGEADELKAETDALRRHKVELSAELLTEVERIVGKGNARIVSRAEADPG